MCFFPRILESLPPLPRQHSADIGCTKNYQPIGVTIHSHCVESFEGLLQLCRRGRGCSELWEKYNFFLDSTLYIIPDLQLNETIEHNKLLLLYATFKLRDYVSLSFFLWLYWLKSTYTQNGDTLPIHEDKLSEKIRLKKNPVG